MIYFINSVVQFAGNPSLALNTTTTAQYTIVVAWRFAVQGTSTMNNNFASVQGGNPIKQVGLVE